MYTRDNIDNFSVSELEEFIINMSQLYYEGNPSVSDDIFDYGIKVLSEKDPNNEYLTTTGHGYDINKTSTRREKYKHPYGNMDSIFDKPRSIEDIPRTVASSANVRISAKLDGISGELIYKDGKLVRALTRGDGDTGLNVTDKARIILKKDLESQESDHRFNFTGSIRGEFVFKKESWNKYKERVLKEDADKKNHRNVASGIIVKSDNEETSYISFIPYKVNASENIEFNNIISMNVFLDTYFFDTVESDIVGFSLLSQTYLESAYERFSKNYPCDGCVITAEEVSQNNFVCNFTECAYKFDSEKAETEVTEIEWNRTRTGKMVPVCKLKTVFISGTNVSRVSAFNAEFIENNKIGVGSVVEVMKSGEIIPDIQRVIKPCDKGELPEVCPVCGEKLVRKGTDLWCTNKNCDGNNEADLYHFTGVIGEVFGLGDAVKRDFFNTNNIKCVEDLYEKSLEEYKYPETPSANKKIKEMMNKLRKEVDPIKALIALNIPRLGWESAKKIVNSELLNVFCKLSTVIQYDFPEAQGTINECLRDICNCVGIATSKSIENNEKRVSRIKLIKLAEPVKQDSTPSDIKGKVVITGKLNTCKRSEFEKIITDAGYILDGGIKKDTLYLITNTPNSGSSKNKKADELGVKKITEEEFLNMIGDKNENE